VLAPVANRTLVTGITGIRALKEVEGKLFHPVLVSIRQGASPVIPRCAFRHFSAKLRLEKGVSTFELLVPQVKSNATVRVTVESAAS